MPIISNAKRVTIKPTNFESFFFCFTSDSRAKVTPYNLGYLKISYKVDLEREVNRNGLIPQGHLMLLVDSTTTTCLMTGKQRPVLIQLLF